MIVDLSLKLSYFVGWTFREKLKVSLILGKDSGSQFRERPVHPRKLLYRLIESRSIRDHAVPDDQCRKNGDYKYSKCPLISSAFKTW